MHIVHICLAAVYIEGWGYQENILPKYHVKMGHKVSLITTYNSYSDSNLSDYVNKDGIHVILLDDINGGRYAKCLKNYKGVYNLLKQLQPDCLFVHGGQFVALNQVIKYCKENRNIDFYIDQHADYYNTPISTFKLWVLQRIIIGHYMRKASKYVTKFWGVTPWRCQYLKEVYGLPEKKIDLLVMGGDDDYIDLKNQNTIRSELRNQYGIDENDFLVVTGGKIDRTKNVHLLLEAIKQVKNKRLKVWVFGKPDEEMLLEFKKYELDERIIFVGWLSSEQVYDYFLAADLAVFPGTHSVLWEQACACGLPGIFKKWERMNHVNVGGNAKFLSKDKSDEIRDIIDTLLNDKDAYNQMKKVAVEQGIPKFSYKNISEMAIKND